MFHEGRVHVFIKIFLGKHEIPLCRAHKNMKKTQKHTKSCFFSKKCKTFSGGHYGPNMPFNGFEMKKIHKHEKAIYEGTLRAKHVYFYFSKKWKGQHRP